MNIDNKLDALKQIKAVDAPPFLLTRIKQQIQNLGEIEAPIKWKWAFALTAVFILALNISIFFTSTDNNIQTALDEKPSGIENIVSSLNLSTTNDFYHE